MIQKILVNDVNFKKRFSMKSSKLQAIHDEIWQHIAQRQKASHEPHAEAYSSKDTYCADKELAELQHILSRIEDEN
jgi:hypothetical protein